MKQIILLKLGEVVLKGQNRYKFEDLLLHNIKEVLPQKGSVRSIQSTIYVDCPDIDADELLIRLSHIFGVSSLCKAAVCSYDLNETAKTAIDYLKYDLLTAKTFKVEAKRADKTFPLQSPQISIKLADAIAQAYPHLQADMKNPDITVFAEVREGNIYIHKTQMKGAGGLPCGSSGTGLLMLSGGLDSPVAGYMMAKRGMKIAAIHFESPPYTSERARLKVEKLAGIVSRYSGQMPVYIVHFTQIQERIKQVCRQELFTVIMRRAMLRIACQVAEQIHAGAVITGESLGQVASQTLEAIVCTDAVADRPVFRPLIGMDKLDIIQTAYKIETYETSIQPYEDCCTIFTPRHPKTKPSIAEMEAEEKKLNLDELLNNIHIERADVTDHEYGSHCQ